MSRFEAEIRRAVVWQCREYPLVSRDTLETAVTERVRAKFPYSPYPGHAWAVFKHLVNKGAITGMWDGDRFGVEKAKMMIPKQKEEEPESNQLGFGFGEK